MTTEEIKIANMLQNLEDLKEASLLLHESTIIYRLCELLQELIPDIMLKK